MEGFTILP